MAETLEFAEWLEMDEGFTDWMRSGGSAVGRGVWAGIGALDAVADKINQIAASVPEIGREVVTAHREINDHPELLEVMQNKASVMDLMRKLAAIDPKKLEAEGKVVLSNKDAGEAIAVWQRSSLPLAVELIVHFGEAIHIGKIIRALPTYFATIWEKFKEIKSAASIWAKAEAIIALVGALLAFLHFLATSAFLSGILAKIAALMHQWVLGGELLLGAYIAWGLVIFLAIAHGNAKNKLLRWIIGFVLALIDPSHGKIDDVKASPRFRKFFGMKPPPEPNQNPAEPQTQQKQQESTLYDLHQSAVDAFPRTTKRQHSIDPIKIVQMEWTPFVGVKTLFIKGLAQNSISGKEYNPQILFKNILYNTNADTRIIASDGLMYEYKKPSVVENDVLVRCSCPDFRWRFAYYNHLDHSLHGRKPAKYNSLGIGPPANPLEMEGMCKHLMKLITALRDADAIE